MGNVRHQATLALNRLLADSHEYLELSKQLKLFAAAHNLAYRELMMMPQSENAIIYSNCTAVLASNNKLVWQVRHGLAYRESVHSSTKIADAAAARIKYALDQPWSEGNPDNFQYKAPDNSTTGAPFKSRLQVFVHGFIRQGLCRLVRENSHCNASL